MPRLSGVSSLQDERALTIVQLHKVLVAREPCSDALLSGLRLSLGGEERPYKVKAQFVLLPKLTPMVEVKRRIELLGPVPTRGGQLLPSDAVYQCRDPHRYCQRSVAQLSAVDEPPIGSVHPLRRRT